jgi:hypothetical protein
LARLSCHIVFTLAAALYRVVFGTLILQQKPLATPLSLTIPEIPTFDCRYTFLSQLLYR